MANVRATVRSTFSTIFCVALFAACSSKPPFMGEWHRHARAEACQKTGWQVVERSHGIVQPRPPLACDQALNQAQDGSTLVESGFGLTGTQERRTLNLNEPLGVMVITCCGTDGGMQPA